ncbi:flagellar hook-basal body protein FliE [Phycisphaerae bacterium RAS1]|nr:flagellar hook-basal body protein FliE [Phycisphaerae bacterium RAS1]
MIDPVSLNRAAPLAAPGQSASPGRLDKPDAGGDFASLVRNQLEQVSQIQAEADRGVQNLLTGRSDSITEVFTAARKAEVAFSLLMEMRNKLVAAFDEFKQMRV